jgi:hypothetical protein
MVEGRSVGALAKEWRNPFEDPQKRQDCTSSAEPCLPLIFPELFCKSLRSYVQSGAGALRDSLGHQIFSFSQGERLWAT